jgi:hypothetical protein
MDFDRIFDFLKPLKTHVRENYVYLSGILGSRPRNMEYRSVFVAIWQFLLKPSANTCEFLAKNSKNLKTHKTHIRDHYL